MNDTENNLHVGEAHRSLQEYLGELFEEPYLDEETGHFYVRYGSTVLEISAEPYGPDEAIVLVMAYCVQGVSTDPELLTTILELNQALPIGAFSLVETDLFVSHALFGRGLTRKTLLGAIAAVATISDDYDDRIVERFGGQTALDRIRETGGRDERLRRATGTAAPVQRPSP